MVRSVKFLLAVGGLLLCPYNAFSTPLSCAELTHKVRVIHCLVLQHMWPKRILNNVCVLRDKMLSDTLTSCISWFISAIQLNIRSCSYMKYTVLKQQTLLAPTTWKKGFEHFRGQSWLSLFHKFPEEKLINLYKCLGNESVQKLLKEPVLAKCSQSLDALEIWFLCHVALGRFPHFWTPIRIFIAFHTENVLEHHL